jgi:tetratricopeptide (TPR) repeat protein
LRLWLTNSALRHQLSAPVLLVIIILVVYYPALFSGIHPIDDPGIFAYFADSPSLTSILLPGNGYYYRPIVEFSFFLDNLLWGMEPRTMHLENILLHCANSLLVYFLARRIIVRKDTSGSMISLFAALLFALHPVNVEAVTWIAGRTDPLLTLFVLCSSYFWLNWLDEPRLEDIAAALLLFGAAILTKETALAFASVAILLVLAVPGSATKQQRLKAMVIMIAPCVLLISCSLVFRNRTSGFNSLLSDTKFQVAQGTWDALIALGFYLKKLIFPFPLNFAITEVHPIYGLLGGAFLPTLWFGFRGYHLTRVLLFSVVLLMLPAILVATHQIAWTPFAERYMYLPTAFLALGLVGICDVLNRKYSVLLLTIFVVLLSGMAYTSFQRNLLWKDTLSFFQDAVAKSPRFGSVYYSLGGIYLQNGKVDLAAKAFATAESLNQRASMRYPIKLGIMGTMVAKGEFLEARTYFFKNFKKKQDAPTDFLDLLYQSDSKRLTGLGKTDKIILANDLLDTLGLLYVRKPDPFWHYRSGQLSLIIEDEARATDYFRRAYSAAPADAHYRSAARTYLQRLERSK